MNTTQPFLISAPKFIHYSPNTLVINNIEFDHADIFNNLDDIKKQFHHLLKIIPQDGNIIYFQEDKNTLDLLNKGNWSQLIPIGTNHSYDIDYKNNLILAQDTEFSMKDFIIFGSHNAKNVISAIAATNVNGASIEESINALKSFQGVKRRLELKYQDSSIIIIDDFAHHPTAIKYSIDAVRRKFKDSKIIGLIELGSNTMSDGIHGDSLVKAASDLDSVIWIDEKEVLLESSNTTFVK
jgi:UDP-N-acetylmuramate: L-alanyl-gamma-D-glutamyl-meso-diaminopimelate ligase